MRAFAFVVAFAFAILSPSIFPSAAQAAWFMRIATIPGTSKDPAHSGWIVIQSFSWKTSSIGGALASARSMAVANDTTVVACSRSAGSGTAVAVKRLDQSSPKLSQALARGAPLGNIEVQQSDASGATVLDANLSDALVSSNQMTVEGGAPEETITFVYERLKVDYRNQDCARGIEPSPTSVTAHQVSSPMPSASH
jgi:type VI protein secretion system component Hcp